MKILCYSVPTIRFFWSMIFTNRKEKSCRQAIVFIILLFVNTLTLPGQDTLQWDIISENEYLTLYQKDSIETIYNYKVEYILNYPLDSVVNYITKPGNYTDWTSNLEDISILETPNDSVQYFHFLLNLKGIFKREGIARTEFISS